MWFILNGLVCMQRVRDHCDLQSSCAERERTDHTANCAEHQSLRSVGICVCARVRKRENQKRRKYEYLQIARNFVEYSPCRRCICLTYNTHSRPKHICAEDRFCNDDLQNDIHKLHRSTSYLPDVLQRLCFGFGANSVCFTLIISSHHKFATLEMHSLMVMFCLHEKMPTFHM